MKHDRLTGGAVCKETEGIFFIYSTNRHVIIIKFKLFILKYKNYNAAVPTSEISTVDVIRGCITSSELSEFLYAMHN